jgi:iron(III) transport system substrate-binding protein
MMDDHGRTHETSEPHATDSIALQRTRRRHFLAACGVTATAGLAGCGGIFGDGEDASGDLVLADFRGSGPLVDRRDPPGGTSMDDLTDLSGSLTLYLGGGEGGLYLDLIDLLERTYPDFAVDHTIQPSSDLANLILEETDASETPADVFVSVDAGTLGAVAAAGVTTTLPDDAVGEVPESYRDAENRWVGVAGRARAVPYNTTELSAGEVPSTVQEFPDASTFRDALGWAPSYSAFQSFVTAMRVIRGEDATRSWLETMLDAGVTEYLDEFRVSNRVADGEIAAGFANHYYALRVRNARPDAPIGVAFTNGDAGALVNVSGATVLSDSDEEELATSFVRHLLSAEAQEFFATRTFAYPSVPAVPPVGDLPPIDELNPPDIDLTDLADVEGTLDLLREVGVL